jgi:hypothetical protein
MFQVLFSPESQAFGIPFVMVLIGGILRRYSKNNQNRGPIRRDIALGYDLALIALTFIVIRMGLIVEQLGTPKNPVSASSLQEQFAVTVVLIFVTFVGFLLLMPAVRDYGWDPDEPTWWVGILLPILFGAAMWALAIYLLGGQL